VVADFWGGEKEFHVGERKISIAGAVLQPKGMAGFVRRGWGPVSGGRGGGKRSRVKKRISGDGRIQPAHDSSRGENGKKPAATSPRRLGSLSSGKRAKRTRRDAK